MKSSKTLFLVLSKLFSWLFSINIGLGIAAVIVQTVNIYTKKMAYSAGYLGSFTATIKQSGKLVQQYGITDIYVYQQSGSTSIQTNSAWHPYFVLLFSIVIIGIVLFYNYQLMHLFKKLNQCIDIGSPFGTDLSNRFLLMSKVSALIFAGAAVLSILKLIFIHAIFINQFEFKPCFDSGILNFAWLSIAFYIISGIFKVGFNLKTEQDLTI